MSFFKQQKLAIVTLVYWFLLVYMVAALVWWFVALEKQNREITDIRLNELKRESASFITDSKSILEIRKRKTAQYLGEGFTFLVLIIVGAVFVFRVTRRQLRLSKQQHNFMMAITHELKTPIAVAQLNLETIQKRNLEEATQQKLIANTLQEVNRLNALCNNYLLTSQLEAGAYQTEKEEINFSDLTEGCVDDFVDRFPKRDIREIIHQGIYLTGERSLLQMLVNNLIENALKYAPKESSVTIRLEEADNRVIFSVLDEGTAIPADEKSRIFEKFYRIGNENTRKTKGTGLGLYLCKKIAENHRGNISVTDNHPNGSIFTVLFEMI